MYLRNIKTVLINISTVLIFERRLVSPMKKFFRALSLCLAIVVAAIFSFLSVGYKETADNYRVTQKVGINIATKLPVSVKAKKNDEIVTAGLTNYAKNRYVADVMLFNVIPIKSSNVEVIEETQLIPCGTPFGIKLFTEGVVVVGMLDVQSDETTVNPAKQAGLQIGDVILTINEAKVNTNEEVAKIIENSNGEELSLKVKRMDNEQEFKLKPVKSAADKCYKAGLWVRDSSAGLGTLTFFDPESKVFGGLGHGICDVDTAEIMPLLNGDIVLANINGVVKGQKGAPGELKGFFVNDNSIGTLKVNDETGVYGIMNENPTQASLMEVGLKQEIRKGPAKILTTIEGGTPSYYDVEIENINYDDENPTKNMIVKITDPTLLEQTGGIVQGMSGSPIIQNDMLIGAVTHVFVNDPTKGYGIFAENMVQTAKELS